MREGEGGEDGRKRGREGEKAIDRQRERERERGWCGEER